MESKRTASEQNELSGWKTSALQQSSIESLSSEKKRCKEVSMRDDLIKIEKLLWK
jgi:hypothetical protein